MKWSSYWSMANITAWRFLTFGEKDIGLALGLQREGCWSDWPNTDSVFSTLASMAPWNLCRISRLCFLFVILRTAVVMCQLKGWESKSNFQGLIFACVPQELWLLSCRKACMQSRHFLISKMNYVLLPDGAFFSFFLIFGSHAKLGFWSAWQVQTQSAWWCLLQIWLEQSTYDWQYSHITCIFELFTWLRCLLLL